MIASLVVWGGELNMKERCFIALAWIPKATVQAAIGPMALDLARERNDETTMNIATQILTLAVISIIATAPIGALAISFSSTKLLSNDNQNTYAVEEIDQTNNQSINMVQK